MKNKIYKILSMTLAIAFILGSLVLLVKDRPPVVRRTYYLWTWMGETNEGLHLGENPLFSITIIKNAGGDSNGFIIMPTIYGEYDEDGNKIPDELVGEIVLGESGIPVLITLPVVIWRDKYNHISFNYWVLNEEEDQLELAFQLNCYEYKNYLIPDLKNPGLRFSDSQSKPGKIFEWIFPRYFAVKYFPAGYIPENKSKLTEKAGLYRAVKYDENKSNEEAYVWVSESDNLGNPYICLVGGRVYETGMYSGGNLIPSNPYASYSFKKNGFLNMKDDTADKSVDLLLSFPASLFGFPEHSSSTQRAILTSTFFMLS